MATFPAIGVAGNRANDSDGSRRSDFWSRVGSKFPSKKGRMMHLIENRNYAMGTEKFGADIPITPQENFVKAVYSSVDEATACGLDRLSSEDGIIPSCRLGCSHCCRYHILTNVAEAHTLAQYVKRELSADQINDLRTRTRQWHEWDDSRPGRYSSANIDPRTDLSNYDHCCPLLVNGACSAYPVRPVVCRTHFVCSDHLSCYAANDPESTQDAPVVLTSVRTATNPFSMAIRDHIEKAGLDFSRSIMLLPHWLAIEMRWDFAISL
jgi:Fe-S-cluster containining protein